MIVYIKEKGAILPTNVTSIKVKHSITYYQTVWYYPAYLPVGTKIFLKKEDATEAPDAK
jgi:hypothetical protein